MKDISIYFKALELDEKSTSETTLGTQVWYHTSGSFPEMKAGDVALIYCPEFRNGDYELSTTHDDRFRNSFAGYYKTANWNFNVVDLGDLLPGALIKDTYFALNQVVTELVKNQIIPIVIGGTQDLTFPMYQAYQNLEQLVNLATIDYRFDLGSPEAPVKSDGYLSQILMHRPCYLFNQSTIGIQMPYVQQAEFDLFEKLYFDACRLGEFNADFRKAEPLLRNSDLLSVDLQSIRFSDITGDHFTQPNGFYAEQICQIARYAGISDKLTSFGIFNLIPGNLGKNTHDLVAQIIWYFLDGVSQRKGDFPIGSKKKYTKFIVHQEASSGDIHFYKSNKSDRWWMEVPYPPSENSRFERHHMVPCNFEDYELAMQGEIPDLWWKTYQKLS